MLAGSGSPLISGGTFTGVLSGGSGGHKPQISGGTFTANGNGSTASYWQISGGYFSGTGFTSGDASISGGYFNASGFWAAGASISGGTLVLSGAVTVNGVPFNAGAGGTNPGFPTTLSNSDTDPARRMSSRAFRIASPERRKTAAIRRPPPPKPRNWPPTSGRDRGRGRDHRGDDDLGRHGDAQPGDAIHRPGAANVVTGVSYSFAGTTENGSYPTTAATQAAQLAADKAAVTAAATGITTATTILGVAGTLNLSTQYTDPGVANVADDVTYTFAGATLTGTLAAEGTVLQKLDAMLEQDAESNWRFKTAAVAGVFLVDLADVQDAAPDDSLATVCLAGLHSGVGGDDVDDPQDRWNDEAREDGDGLAGGRADCGRELKNEGLGTWVFGLRFETQRPKAEDRFRKRTSWRDFLTR